MKYPRAPLQDAWSSLRGVIEICKYEVIRTSPCGLNNRERILVPYRLKKNRRSYKQIELKKRENKKKGLTYGYARKFLRHSRQGGNWGGRTLSKFRQVPSVDHSSNKVLVVS
jgi:hypothetical protein